MIRGAIKRLLDKPNPKTTKPFVSLRKPFRIGTDQGVNFQQLDWHNKIKQEISHVSTDIMEYTKDNLSIREADGFEESRKLVHEQRQLDGVRWVNVEGRNLHLLRELALKYQLHPLSIEDTIYGDSATRPKAEYFSNALFVTLPLHSLGDTNGNEPTHMHKLFQNARKASKKPEVFDDKGEVRIDVQLLSLFLLRDGWLSFLLNAQLLMSSL